MLYLLDILVTNYQSFQGLLDRTVLFSFACRMARYKIEEKDHRKCMLSFYSYARQLSTMRERITKLYKKEEFDYEVYLNIHIFICNNKWYCVLRFFTQINSVSKHNFIFIFQIASWIPPILPLVSNVVAVAFEIILRYIGGV